MPWPGALNTAQGRLKVDDHTKAKGLMAAGLFILAAIGLVVVLVVLPAIHSGSGSPTAVAQVGAGPMSPAMGMEPGPGETPGGAPGAAPAGPMPGGMPAMGGAPGGAAPGGAAPGGPAGAVSAKAVEPLEPSRENPFAPMGAVGGKAQEKVRPESAYRPGPAGFPVGLREQNHYPVLGPNGESIHVPSGVPSPRSAAGPQRPPTEEFLQVPAIMRDAQGRAMVVLQAGPGQTGQVLQVGDRWQGFRVEKITNTEMVLAKQEGGQIVRKVLRLRVGGGGRPATGTGPTTGGTRPGVTVPGARGTTTPGAGGGTQPGIRRPGGAAPGAFPGVGGGGAAPGGGAGGGQRQ